MHRPAKRTGKPGVFAPYLRPTPRRRCPGWLAFIQPLRLFKSSWVLAGSVIFALAARLFRHHSRARSRCAVTGINLSPPRREIRTNQKRDASGVAGYRPMFWTMREGCGLLVRPRHDPPRFVGSTPRRFERPMPVVETCSRYALSTLLNVSLRPGSTDCPLSCSQHRAPRPPLRHGW